MARLLSEGGNAVAVLLPSLEKHQDNTARKLYVGKIGDADLDLLLPEQYGVFPKTNDHSYIGKLLSILGDKGLLDKNYAPTFLLGSSRLAALKKYGKDAIWTDKLETDDIIQAASGKKVEFGDIDADVVFLGDKKQIVQTINEIDPSTFAARYIGEIHIAIRLGDKVIQVDLVDMSKDKESLRFRQKSSFIDLASGIKGAIGTRLLRATVANMDIAPEDALDTLYTFANNNPAAPFSIALQKKTKNGYVPTRVRFTLAGEGLKLAVDLKKEKDGKEIQDKVEFDVNPRVDYKDLDLLAKQILQHPAATASDIFHTISLASFLAKNKKEKIPEIWKYFLNICEKTLKDHIDQEDYETGIKEVGRILGVNNSRLNEAREAIGRFEGKNQFSNSEVLELLKTIVKETHSEGKEQLSIDLKENPVVDMIEKMDSNFSHFGIDRNGKFFMESSNSGPVYDNTVNQKFGFSKDLSEPFKYLSSNARFQSSLKKIFKTVGPFRYDAELFPILTHKGNEKNEIVFVATKYKKEKFGTFGAFVLFKAWLWNDSALSWYRPEPAKNIQLLELLKHEAISSGWNKDWKIYSNESDMKLGGNISINLGKILAYYLSNDHLYNKAGQLLKLRSKNPEKEELVSELNKLRMDLQGSLDEFANQTHSVLGDSNSSIEGVILRVKEASGDIYEVKGTSKEFALQKDATWHDRTEILNLENVLEGRFLKEVLGLKSSQPAALNKEISSAADDFITIESGKNKKAEFIKFLVPRMVTDERDFDLTKSIAITVLSEIEKEYHDLLTSFNFNKPRMDQDSVRKTEEFFFAFKEKFQSYKELVHSSLNGPEFYVHAFNTILGFRMDKFLNFSEEYSTEEEEKREKVIIWNGRAQPWHKGHDAMIQRGKEHLKKLGATKILIMIIKGGQSSLNHEENPLNEKEQAELLYSIYRHDPQVEIYKKFPKSSFIVDIIEHVSTTGYVISGWLAGSDRFTDYRRALKGFNPAIFKQTHDYSPILFDRTGTPLVEMIETPRLMSGTKARQLTKEVDFQTWIEEVAPLNIDSNAVRVYQAIYNKIRGENLQEHIVKSGDEYCLKSKKTDKNLGCYSSHAGAEKREKQVQYFKHLGEDLVDEILNYAEDQTIEEMSGAGGGGFGGIEGIPGKRKEQMDREQFLEELKLRKHIKDAIRLHEQKEKAVINEEKKLRSIVRKLIKESEEDRPHHSTGINVLSDLLKKVVPVLEIDYKKMTSSPTQRQSFRAHILKAAQNALATERVEDTAGTDEEAQIQEDDNSASIDLGIQDKPDPEQEKFIDIERPSQKNNKQQKPDPKDAFGIEGEDETGRNIAMASFQKVEKAVVESYSILSDAEDKRLFYDYLITNLKLYFDKFEDELKANVEEPGSDTYEQEKSQQQTSQPTGDLGEPAM